MKSLSLSLSLSLHVKSLLTSLVREPELTLYRHRPTCTLYVDELPAQPWVIRYYWTWKLVDETVFNDALPTQFSVANPTGCQTFSPGWRLWSMWKVRSSINPSATSFLVDPPSRRSSHRLRRRRRHRCRRRRCEQEGVCRPSCVVSDAGRAGEVVLLAGCISAYGFTFRVWLLVKSPLVYPCDCVRLIP